MKKTKNLIIAFILLLLIPTTFIGARLSDFKDDLRNADDNSSYTSNKDDNKSSSTDDEDDSPSLLGIVRAIGHVFKYLGFNSTQTFANHPYQYKNIPFNLHTENKPANRKKWTLATTIEYQRFDKQLNALVLDLDLTFAGFLKLKVSSNSLQEQIVNYKDSLTLFNFMLGLDLVTFKNFSFGMRFGFQKVTDLDLDMFAYDFNLRFFPTKPLVVDLLWTGAVYKNVSTEELKVRLGFIAGMYDFGIGYSWLKLNNAEPMNAINFSVRFWM